MRDLSPRETELLQHICNGDQLKHASRKMGIELGTARKYSKTVHYKLGARTAAQAVAIGLSCGILKPPICRNEATHQGEQ